MNIMEITRQCVFILSALIGPDNQDAITEHRVAVCSLIVEEAARQQVPTTLALAVAWARSGFHDNPRPLSRGAGPLGINTKYWCPNKEGTWSAARPDGVLSGCDVYERGIFALKYYLNRALTVESALCTYSWGDCGTENRRGYVREVLRYQSTIEWVFASLDRYQTLR